MDRLLWATLESRIKTDPVITKVNAFCSPFGNKRVTICVNIWRVLLWPMLLMLQTAKVPGLRQIITTKNHHD
jgi:hypothetical protein